MRYQGKLKKWNAERGFGFIVANDGGQDIFVHVSAFPRDGKPATEGEALSFEIEPDRDGKKKAARVSRPGAQPRARVYPPAYIPAAVPASRMSRAPQRSGFGSKLVTLCILAALGSYGYKHFAERTVQLRSESSMLAVELTAPKPSTFQCDGRKYCSQMTSCTEARLFLKNCPGVQMDGNHDGVPCEQQWCTSPLAK
jgi:cold shock CspA family protein